MVLFTSTMLVLMLGCGGRAPADGEPAIESRQAVVAQLSAFAKVTKASGTWAVDPAYSSGSNITLTHVDTGSFRVSFPNIGNPVGGDVQVNPTAAIDDVRCKVQSWSTSGTTRNVNILCFNTVGSAVDIGFVVSFVYRSDTPGVEGGYVWAYDASNPAYSPIAAGSAYAWNSTGQPINITHHGAAGSGSYTLQFVGQAFSTVGGGTHGGTVEITAYGTAPFVFCTVVDWYEANSDMFVDVQCWSGQRPIDSQFTAILSLGSGSLNVGHSPNGTTAFTYLWANQPTADSYTPDGYYQQGLIASDHCGALPTPGPVTIVRHDEGRYWVTFPGMAMPANSVFSKVHFIVTAYGSSPIYCFPGGLILDRTPPTLIVTCIGAGGGFADSYFTVTYSTTQFIIC